MSFFKEFREFAMKGNVVDMAVGVIIGAGFGKIVSSLVSDILTPPLGVILGGVDFTNLAFTIKEASAGAAAVSINYGKFIQSIFDFTIIALTMFSVIKLMNRIKKTPSTDAPALTTQETLLTEIRDLLKK